MQLREQGVALIVALMTMVLVAGIGSLLFARTVGEMQHSRDDAAIIQTLLLARGGANLGGAVLAGPIRNDLDDIVRARSSTTTCWSFGSGACSAGQPTAGTVATALTGSSSVATQLQSRIDAALCADVALPEAAGATVRVRVHVTGTACGQGLPGNVRLPAGRFVSGSPRPASQEYAIPFVMVAEAAQGPYQRNVVLQGEYRFTVGRPTFARYALFTNRHSTPDGGDIWFTENTLFDGPVHTNEAFRFYRNPWFGGDVTTAGCSDIRVQNGQEYCHRYHRRGAEFYGSGFVQAQQLNSPTSPSYSNAYGRHAPEFTAGIDWHAEYVALPQNAFEQRAEAQANGLYLSGHQTSVRLWAATADGAPLTRNAQGRWTPAATYQYIEATGPQTVCTRTNPQGHCTRTEVRNVTTTYRYGANGVLERQLAGGTWQTERGDFNGVIYVEGRVDRLTGPARGSASDRHTAPPALASFAQLTLAAEQRVRITGDLTYETPPCTGSPSRRADGTVQPATCNELGARNVLGVYVQDENIQIGHNNVDATLNAPQDVTIHGVLMSSRGVVEVENFRSGLARGDVHLLGGVIENHYGGFGTFNSASGNNLTGYGRKFTYDQRMYTDVAPPYFPTVGVDGVQSVRLFSFGQREQIY